MRKTQRLLLYLPLLVIVLSLLFNYRYQKEQALTVLEGNGLKTPSHRMIPFEKVDKVLPQLNKLTGQIWLMASMTDGKHPVLTVLSSNWSKMPLPLKTGRLPSANGVQEALVGQSVKTIIENHKEYVTVFDRSYEVVGRIGQLENSPLTNYVLISDAQFLELGEEFSLNGDINDSQLANFGERGDNRGIERLFATSRFALMLQISTILLVFISTLIWIYFIVSKKNQEYGIYHMLGKSYRDIYKIESLKLLGLNLSLMASFGTFFLVNKDSWELYLQLLLLVLLEILSFTYFFYRRKSNEVGL